MLIVRTEQNLIQINFSTTDEEIYLADMLKISSPDNNGVIAQVVKIESLDENKNVNIATAKILFTLLSSGKLTAWQGNVPSRDFQLSIVEPAEILAITNIHEDNNSVFIGQLSSCPQAHISVNPSLLERPSIIVGDAETSKNNFIKLMAYELADKNSNVVIVDPNGDFLDLEDALVLRAGKDIKLPLDVIGLENLYNKTLINVTAETKANIENIFSEIEEYLLSGEASHIPFTAFLCAIDEEYQANNIPELSLLSNSLKKLHRKGVFANNQKEINRLFTSFKQNNLIVLDLSEIDETWKEDFVDIVIRLNKEKYKGKFFLINNLLTSNLTKKILNQGLKSGISPIFSMNHDSEIISEILPKIENIFALSALNSSKITNLQHFLQKLGNSEVIIYGKITNNVPLYIKIPGLEEDCPEITINQSFVENIEEVYQEEQYEEQEEQQEEYPQQDTEYNAEMNLLLGDDEETEEIQETQEEETEQQYYSSSYSTEYSANVQGDDNFDYNSSEEFQDESVLDYINNEETEEAVTEEELEEEEETTYEPQYYQQYEPQAGQQGFTDEDLNNFVDLDEEELEDEVEEEVEEYEEEVQQVIELPKKAGKKMPGPPTSDLPVYNVAVDDNKTENAKIDLNEGDKVKHKKYGNGVIKKVIGYSDRKLCSIQFDEVGRRLLDPKLAELELVSKM
ncbi:MAG: hypothetical protein A2Y25_09145 [Candidatus Melainabacteria bacterium GWF2_37_15]|nr:MAG: hypothetical protein A2Y25_09145 [Candidatus Melainabacteria bacterium GWF2_37_15]